MSPQSPKIPPLEGKSPVPSSPPHSPSLLPAAPPPPSPPAPETPAAVLLPDPRPRYVPPARRGAGSSAARVEVPPPLPVPAGKYIPPHLRRSATPPTPVSPALTEASSSHERAASSYSRERAFWPHRSQGGWKNAAVGGTDSCPSCYDSTTLTIQNKSHDSFRHENNSKRSVATTSSVICCLHHGSSSTLPSKDEVNCCPAGATYTADSVLVSKRCWADVPVDILHTIFRFLDRRDDSTLLLTCRTWCLAVIDWARPAIVRPKQGADWYVLVLCDAAVGAAVGGGQFLAKVHGAEDDACKFIGGNPEEALFTDGKRLLKHSLSGNNFFYSYLTLPAYVQQIRKAISFGGPMTATIVVLCEHSIAVSWVNGPGERIWAACNVETLGTGQVLDLAFAGGQVYFMDSGRRLFTLRWSGDEIAAEALDLWPPGRPRLQLENEKVWLMEGCDGCLLCVICFVRADKTCKAQEMMFEAFALQSASTGHSICRELQELENQTVFISWDRDSSSFCTGPSERWGLCRNRLYDTEMKCFTIKCWISSQVSEEKLWPFDFWVATASGLVLTEDGTCQD